MDYNRMETLAVDLAKINKGNRTFADKDVERMADLAASLDARAYAAGWVQLLNWPFLGVAPVSVNTFTTTQTIMSPAPQLYIPANSMQVGTRFRIRSWGSVANSGATTTTLGLAVTGQGIAAQVICASATGTPGAGPLPWWFEGECTVLAVGAAATASIIGQGIAFGITATPTTCVLVPASAPTALAATWTSTVANMITVNATFGASAAGNAYITYGASVEQLN